MTIQIAPERLAKFETLTLDHGGHRSFESGHCAMEVVAWLADEGHTDAPQCASPVLARYVIRLNDRWDDDKRQSLKPYLIRMIGTGSDGKDPIREKIALKYIIDLLTPWLRLAGLDAEAERLAAASDPKMVRDALWAARSAAWAARRKTIDKKIRPAIEAELKKQGKPVAVAVAAAAAVADAAAAAVAAAVAVAAAAADAVAVAVAAAVADAAAAAVAAADAAAVAAADAAAAAAAAAAADAAAADPNKVDWWGKPYSAAYQAAKAHYEANPLPIAQEVADLAANQNGAALALLDRLINAEEE